MQFGEQPVPLVGEEEGDLERKRLALRGASHKRSGSSSCVQHRALCVSGEGLRIQPGGRRSRTFQRVCTFPCCFTVARKTKFKTEIEEGKQERNICRGGQRAHSSLSPDHNGASRAWQDGRHIIVVTERRPASWQTGARPSGEFPGCSAAGTLHFHCKGGLDSVSG